MPAEKINYLSELSIAAITFDLDDTLWPCAPVIAGAEQVYYEWIAKHYPEVALQHDLSSMTTMRREILKAEPKLENDVTELRRRATVELLGPYGAGETEVAEVMQVCIEARQQVSLYDEVQEGLEQLSFHYRLGSITNGNADLQSIGIGHLFDVELAATMALPAKPAKDMFLKAFAALGVQPERVLHVGDNPHTDVLAAQNVGCKTAWMNRDGAVYPADVPAATFDITSLNDLVAMAPPVPS